MSERLNGLFRQDVQDRKKRAFEILGELISTISGVPSAQDHRALLEKVKMLKLDADGVKQLMRDQARNNEQILQTIHTHDTEIDNLESNMATAFTNLKITSGWLINSVAVMTAFSQTMAVGRKIESTIETAERILAKSDQGLLDRASISESSLSRKIDQIYLKRNANTPVLSGCLLYTSDADDE